MATVFPASLDTFVDPVGTDLLSTTHTAQHDTLNDCVAAIEAKVGVDNSAVTTSLDYKIRHLFGTPSNILLGNNPGASLTTGSSNIVLGDAPLAAAADHRVVIGYGATDNGDNTITLGRPATDTLYPPSNLKLANETTGLVPAPDLVITGSDAKAGSGKQGGWLQFLPGAGDGAGASGGFEIQLPRGNALQFTDVGAGQLTLNNGINILGNGFIQFANNGVIEWGSGSPGVSVDTGISRSVAGVIQLNNGTWGFPASAPGITIPSAVSGAGKTFTLTGSSAAIGSGANGGNIALVPGALDGAGLQGRVIVRQPGGTAGVDEYGLVFNAGTMFFLPSAGNTGFGPGNCSVSLSAGPGGQIQTIGRVRLSGLIDVDVINSFVNIGGVRLTFGSGETSNRDCGLQRLASKVLNTCGGIDDSAASWLQNTAGEAILASAFTDATGTLAATNLSWTVIAGRYYDIDLTIQVSNSTAGDGFQMDFGGGTCSATTFWVEASTPNGSNVAGTTTATSLTGVLNWTTVTGTNYIRLRGRLKVNAAGTLIIRAATNTHVSGTMTLGALSGGYLRDTVAL